MALQANVNVTISPQGYQINDAPENKNPFWDDNTPAGTYIADLSLTQSGDVYTLTATMGDGTEKEIGIITAAGGTSSAAITGIAITNENGIYTFTATMGDGTEKEIGTIEVPEQPDIDNLIAEVNDSIVENTASGYDYHTITETEHNGTRNNVGSFYLARNQITGVTTSGSILTLQKVNQSGEESSEDIALPAGTTPDISATASVDDTTGTPAVVVTKTGTEDAPAFDFAFTGLKGATGAQGEQGAIGETGAAGVSPTVASTGSTESGAAAGTITDADGNTITVYNGAQGEQGATGEAGAAGTTPDISATASVDDTTGTPAVTVTKTGTEDAPAFDFAFTGLKGEAGSSGSSGLFTKQLSSQTGTHSWVLSGDSVVMRGVAVNLMLTISLSSGSTLSRTISANTFFAHLGTTVLIAPQPYFNCAFDDGDGFITLANFSSYGNLSGSTYTVAVTFTGFIAILGDGVSDVTVRNMEVTYY